MKKPKTKKPETFHLRGVVATIEGPGVSGLFANVEATAPDAGEAVAAFFRGLGMEPVEHLPARPKLPSGKGPR